MLNSSKGLYDNRATYQFGDAITHESMVYICIRSTVTGCPPPDLDIWERMRSTTTATGLSLGPVGSVGISGCPRGISTVGSSSKKSVDTFNIYLVSVYDPETSDGNKTDAIVVVAESYEAAELLAKSSGGRVAGLDPKFPVRVELLGQATGSVSPRTIISSTHGNYCNLRNDLRNCHWSELGVTGERGHID